MVIKHLTHKAIATTICRYGSNLVAYLTGIICIPGMCRTVEKSKPIINCNEVDISKIRS